MNKSTVIALLVGLLVGQACAGFARADVPGFSRHDLMEAAALAGILANNDHDPLGYWGWGSSFRQPVDFQKAAKDYADAMK